MKLDDCVLKTTHAWGRPPSPGAPEREWTDARDRSIIPQHLYRFYCLADYFGYDRAPRFLADTDRMLFSFLAGVVQSLLESFDEAHSLAASIREDEGKGYSPVKKLKHEPYDPEADVRQRRSFRHLIVALSGALDQLAEVVSVLFHGEIKGLTVGRSSFSQLRELTKRPYAPRGIVSPRAARFEQLHQILVEELDDAGEDEQWFELFQLYRNKLTHLGSSMFPIVSLHDRKGVFYSFTPNRWPLFHQSGFESTGTKSADPRSIENYARENYIHQDLVSYSEQLLARIFRLAERSFEVLCGAYTEFREFDPNTNALQSLKDKQQQFRFRSFE